MDLFVKKTLTGLIPASRNEFDKLQEAKLKLNEYYQVKITKPRNIMFHRKFMALINLGYENQERFSDFEQFRKWVIIMSGYYIEIIEENEIFKIAKSISFANMDQIDFEKLYNAAIDVILKLIGCERQELMQAVVDFI